ncbi:MAG: deoxyribonuclease V [Dehalococcoidia bacterium]
MRVRRLHPWRVSPAEAVRIQADLAPRVISEGDPAVVRYVAGADIALPRGRTRATAAVVLLSYPGLALVERHAVESEVNFPYVPGLLAFREVPVLARAFERLVRTPDLLLVDGHGYSHPRRFGLACHLGLLLDVPTIGVAKSRLTGVHGDPPPEAGGRTPLRDGDEVIGLVLRTRTAVSPVFVSVGHRIGLAAAADWTLRLCQGYRLPEPTRLADKLSRGRLPVP